MLYANWGLKKLFWPRRYPLAVELQFSGCQICKTRNFSFRSGIFKQSVKWRVFPELLVTCWWLCWVTNVTVTPCWPLKMAKFFCDSALSNGYHASGDKLLFLLKCGWFCFTFLNDPGLWPLKKKTYIHTHTHAHINPSFLTRLFQCDQKFWVPSSFFRQSTPALRACGGGKKEKLWNLRCFQRSSRLRRNCWNNLG